MITKKSNSRILQIYSGNRNRNLFSSPSSFEIPFSPTLQSQYNGQNKYAEDVVCKGGIYYKFTYTPQTNLTGLYGQVTPSPTIVYTSAIYAPGSTRSRLILNFGIVATLSVYQIIKFTAESLQNFYQDFYSGFEIYNVGIPVGGVNTPNIIGEKRTIRTYDPTTGVVTLDRPFDNDPIIDTYAQGFGCYILNPMPTKYSWFIPTLDNNLNYLANSPLYYNGYYLTFGSSYPPFISSNGPPFFRRIIYYDYIEHIAYFEEPLPFDFAVNPPESNITLTLRKDPQLERYQLDTSSYFNKNLINPTIGPLPGYVITLPSTASSIDNYYKGKYIYDSSAGAQVYSPPLPPQTEIKYPISVAFYPIYGLYYISAYNGTTKECSVQMVSSKDNLNAGYLPTYEQLSNITSASLEINTDDSINNFRSPITNPSPGIYRGNLRGTIFPVPPFPVPDPATLKYRASLRVKVQPGRRYRINISLRVRPILNPSFCYFQTGGVTFPFWSIDKPVGGFLYLTSTFQTYTFVNSTNSDSDYIIFYFYYNNAISGYIEWTDLSIFYSDNINILEYKNDNFNPLDYNGSITDTNETSCYNITLSSLTLPNRPLVTGSKIAFYQYVYVVLENYTSPSKHGNAIIISNNDNSNRAVFIASCAQVSDPDQQDFVTLSGATSQKIKFKPNDNLFFSVYLSDGSPFQSLIPDTFSPYEADPAYQINAIFSITRST